MRIERIRVDGFGLLSGVDVAWPEDRLLLVLDPNESGKTTLCEAIVAALYGLPRGRVGGARLREQRRPRNGAPLRVGLDVSTGGARFTVDRDLEVGTLRVVDRDRGSDVTRQFLRGGGRDVFGDETTGLTEPLFRTTAYVSQNVLNDDELDSTLTVELARIADSGGGEASVVRALRALQEVRGKMPNARSGLSVSVETEILRLTKRVAEQQDEVDRRRELRESAAEASRRLSQETASRDSARDRAALAELAGVVAERRALSDRLDALDGVAEVRGALESEARALAADAEVFAPEKLAEIDRLREARGPRPDALERECASLAAERRLAEEERRDRTRRFGPIAALDGAGRERLAGLLNAVAESAEELERAGEALEAQWEELRREGLADDLARLDGIGGADREFLVSAEEERAALELEGVQHDRKAAETSANAAIAVGERRERVKRAKGLLLTSGPVLLLSAGLWASGGVRPTPIAAAVAAFGLSLAVFSAIAWARGARHRREDEAALREEEAEARRQAVQVRKRLSELRLRLDRVARSAGFGDATSLLRSYRRARASEEKRRRLIERGARRDAAAERRRLLAEEVGPFREAIGCSAGLPSASDAQRTAALLADLERAVYAGEAREAALVREAERLGAEDAALRELERALGEALERVGVPRRLSLPEALLVVESGRRRAARRREIVDVELPARATPDAAGERERLSARIASLDGEVAERLTALGLSAERIPDAETPEEARRLAEEVRRQAQEAEEARARAERELAARAREGGEQARAAEEALEEARADLERARLFRDALDLSREALAAAASAAYGDFKKGLSETSREVLASWDVPYEALEFGDDLSVSVVARGGRVVTKAEVAASLSTGAREQIHLTARLSALRYLGTGSRGVPLLLDDPLVGADDDRFVAVMRFLLANVLPERPVLLASCHFWRHERLLGALPGALAERVQVVSLSAPGGAREASRASIDGAGEPEYTPPVRPA